MSRRSNENELRLQKACESLADQNIAFAAHDLCNHLQVISSAFALVQKTVSHETTAPVMVILDGARLSLERASRLSRQIVNSGGSGQTFRSPVSIAKRLQGLCEAMRIITGPDIRVELFIDDEIPEVLCAAEALDDALLNIVGNSVRAMPKGGRIAIKVTQEFSTDLVPSVVLRIADTGCGMPAEVAARAFEPRFTTRAPGVGSGIGLAMVAAFSRSAGGSADLETCPNVGTVVTIRLPGVPRRVRSASNDATSGR